MSRLLARLALDFTAVSLLLAALAYNWLGNLAHEIIGTTMFLLLISHTIFNRRWYLGLTEGWRRRGAALTKVVNLSLLAAMLALLVTSIVISQSVFSVLPVTSTFTARQIHSLAAYLALLIAAAHLGLHWSMIMGVARNRLGMAAASRGKIYLLRIIAFLIAAWGVRSLVAINVGAKLLMQPVLGFGDPQIAPLAVVLDHASVVGLGACLAHYTAKFRCSRRRTHSG